MRTAPLALSLLLAAAGAPMPAHASDVGKCPASTPANGPPPSGKIAVTILSADLNSDMEGDDDYIPFYDNRADIYGKVRIEGEEFTLPEIGDDDSPEWLHENRFEHAIQNLTSNAIPIEIELWDADSGWTGDDNQVDMSPDATRKTLKLTFNPCAMTIAGDHYGRGVGVFEIDNSAGGDTGGTFRLKVEMADGKPLAQNDVSLADFDLVQVLPGRTRLVAGKPAVAMLRVGSTSPATVGGTVRVQIWNPAGTIRDVTVPLDPPLGPNEVRTLWMFADDPVIIPAAGPISATATVSPTVGYSAALPCYVINNTSGTRTWSTVGVKPPKILWARTGLLLDLTALIPEHLAKNVYEMSVAYIDAIYPFPENPNTLSPFPIVPPLTTAADWLFAILGGLGTGIDNVKPFVMLLELGAIAYVAGYDRFIGILPKDWFANMSWGWFDQVRGLSLGDGLPRAVMFQGHDTVGGVPGHYLVNAAHELGHTYGLSANADIKNSWVCNVDWGPLGQTPCGIVGGLDEYGHPEFSDGLPTWGFWVRQLRPVPASMASLPGKPQCESHCMMGFPQFNPEQSWDFGPPAYRADLGDWIDHSDYEQLIDRMSGILPFQGGWPALMVDRFASAVPHSAALPQYAYVSGMIAWDDRAYAGPLHITTEPRTLDPTDPASIYRARFVSATGVVLKEIGVPLDWNSPDHRGQVPVTFFGLTTTMPGAARKLQLWNAKSGKLLFEKKISVYAPKVTLTGAQVASKKLTVSWSAGDADGDALEHMVLVSKDGATWWPAALAVKGASTTIDVNVLAAGSYKVRVISSDGARLARSADGTFTVPLVTKPPIGPIGPIGGGVFTL